MKVTSIVVNIRYAKEIEGSWKTIELGLHATLDDEEAPNWPLCQHGLYALLSQQLKDLWNQNGHNGSESHVEGTTWEEIKAIPSPQNGNRLPQREHFCLLHQVDFNRFEKGGQVWYSHKAEGTWCKEPRALK
jgi:hypothetical protein